MTYPPSRRGKGDTAKRTKASHWLVAATAKKETEVAEVAAAAAAAAAVAQTAT